MFLRVYLKYSHNKTNKPTLTKTDQTAAVLKQTELCFLYYTRSIYNLKRNNLWKKNQQTQLTKKLKKKKTVLYTTNKKKVFWLTFCLWRYVLLFLCGKFDITMWQPLFNKYWLWILTSFSAVSMKKKSELILYSFFFKLNLSNTMNTQSM